LHQPFSTMKNFLTSLFFYLMNVPSDLEILPEVLGDNSLKSDMIHPNDKGYTLIATQIHSLLVDSGAL